MALVTFDDRELMGRGNDASNFVWCRPSADLSAGWISNWAVINSRGTGFTVSGTDITCNKNGTIRVCVMIDNMNGSTQQDKGVVIYKNSTAISQGYEYGAYSACITAQAMVNVVVGDVIKIATSTGTTKQQFSTLLCEYINEYYLVSYANPNNSYSTNETATGGVWIDGKPIYQTCISTTMTSNSTWTTVAHGIANIDRIIELTGTLTNGADGRMYTIPQYRTGTGVGVTIGADQTNIYYIDDWISGTNSVVYFVKYTKTTD